MAKEKLAEESDHYPLERVREEILTTLTSLGAPTDQLEIKVPPHEVQADLAIACFPLAKTLHMLPNQIAQQLAQAYHGQVGGLVERASAEKGYLNFHLNPETFENLVVESILTRGKDYGKENVGHGEKVVIDASSPNSAKELSIAHAWSTALGFCVTRLLRFTDHDVTIDNHIGDWGTQFGQLLMAVETWGHEYPDLNTPGQEVNALLQLYVKINQEIAQDRARELERLKNLVQEKGLAAINGLETEYQRNLRKKAKELSPEEKEEILVNSLKKFIPSTKLEEAGRDWFRRLEANDLTARKRWAWATELSMKEFNEVYQLLHVEFDLCLGESFYVPMLDRVVNEVGQLEKSKHRDELVVDLQEEGLGRMRVITQDGRSLYGTRDLATIMYRQETLRAKKIIYVVGANQETYLRQVFAAARKLGYSVAKNCKHLPFGRLTDEEGAMMSTRKGNVVFLRDVIHEGIDRVRTAAEGETEEQKAEKSTRNKHLFSLSEANREEIYRKIAVGAIFWAFLGSDRNREIRFDWDEMLSFDGYSAPYVQYAHARGCSLLRRAEDQMETITENKEMTAQATGNLVKKLAEFPSAVKSSATRLNPVEIASYAHELAQLFNQFYRDCPILRADPLTRTRRLNLVKATTQVIRNSLYLLGIEAPEVM